MKIIKQGFVSPKAKNNFRYNAWPTVISLADGTLLAGWSGDRLKHICPFGRVMMARSNDGGYTWLPPYCVQDTPLDDRDAGLLQVEDRIIMSSFNNDRAMQRRHLDHWLHAPNSEAKRAFISAYLDMITDEDEETVGPTLAVSKDNGYTFSDPINVPVTSPHGPMVTRDGKILFIGALNSFKVGVPDDTEPGIYIMEIDKDLNVIEAPRMIAPRPEEFNERSNWCEPHAAEMPNGDILVFIRREDKLNGIHTVYSCRSTDGGKTFSKAVNTGWDGFPPHIFVDSKDRVIVSYGKRHDPMGIRARVSYDNGYTFGEEIILRDDGLDWDLGYPSTTENADGQLVTVYYMKEIDDVNENRIQYTIWEI